MFRKMRRIKQQITEDECIRILKENPRGVVRMPACHAGGRRFEPDPDRQFIKSVVGKVAAFPWSLPAGHA